MEYIIKPEYRENWNPFEDVNNESQWIVDEAEILRLAREWGCSVDTLMEQVEERRIAKMFEAKKASVELKRRQYLKLGGYSEGIAIDNDTEQETIAKFETLEGAKKYLEGKNSYISPYPSNGLVKIEEYYIEEVDEDDNPIGVWHVAPLDEDSEKYIHDIYAEREEE